MLLRREFALAQDRQAQAALKLAEASNRSITWLTVFTAVHAFATIGLIIVTLAASPTTRSALDAALIGLAQPPHFAFHKEEQTQDGE